MSNGARHGLGAVIGVVVTPIIAVCLLYGMSKLGFVARYSYGSFRNYHGSELWVGTGVMVVAAVLLGLVVGSRLSPLASLVPGALYAITGLLWIVDPVWTLQNTARDPLPESFARGYLILGPYGLFTLLGVLLIAASVLPSRWQARTGAAPRFGGPPPAPMGPPHMHGASPHMGAPQPPQAPPSPGQSPASWQGAPQYGQEYGQAPAQPVASNPPPLPPSPPAAERPKPSSGSGGPDDDEPGEWTRMYGGNR